MPWEATLQMEFRGMEEVNWSCQVYITFGLVVVIYLVSASDS